jgi:hypothetical protein
VDITQEMLDQSSQEEGQLLLQSPNVLMAQNQFLQQRVVLLRALVNEQQAEIDRLKAKVEKKPAKKTAARQPSAQNS